MGSLFVCLPLVIPLAVPAVTSDAILTTGYAQRLGESLPRVRDLIASAEEAASRPAGSVRLVAVTKSHPFGAVRAALDAGLTDLGENRLEELEAKVAEFGPDVARWHMIGHVQSRKAGQCAGLADVIHAVDTTKLAERLARLGEERGRDVHVLMQVNTSGEASKSGFDGEAAREEILRLADLEGLQIDGLMTMAPFVDDPVVLSSAFAGLREIHASLRTHSHRVGPELSMGMTNDLEIAIREGSTMVRIGTALFGARSR